MRTQSLLGDLMHPTVLPLGVVGPPTWMHLHLPRTAWWSTLWFDVPRHTPQSSPLTGGRSRPRTRSTATGAPPTTR